MTTRNRTRRAAYVAAAAVVVAAPSVAAAAMPTAAGTMSAPTHAAVGETITVHASGLIPAAGYSLVLNGGTAPNKNDFCAGDLSNSPLKAKSLTFKVRIPSTIKCWSGYPASRAGSTHVTPGKYMLWVQMGEVTNEGGYSFIKRTITITG